MHAIGMITPGTQRFASDNEFDGNVPLFVECAYEDAAL